MASGTLKFFDAKKGYGFIIPDDRAADVFVHITAIDRAGITKLVEGDPIHYDVVPDERSGRPRADNITLSLPATTH